MSLFLLHRIKHVDVESDFLFWCFLRTASSHISPFSLFPVSLMLTHNISMSHHLAVMSHCCSDVTIHAVLMVTVPRPKRRDTSTQNTPLHSTYWSISVEILGLQKLMSPPVSADSHSLSWMARTNNGTWWNDSWDLSFGIALCKTWKHKNDTFYALVLVPVSLQDSVFVETYKDRSPRNTSQRYYQLSAFGSLLGLNCTYLAPFSFSITHSLAIHHGSIYIYSEPCCIRLQLSGKPNSPNVHTHRLWAAEKPWITLQQ